MLWLDLLDPDMDGLDSVREEFGLHPLAVEDALNPNPQRAKVERYGEIAFLVVRTARYLQSAERTESSEVIDTGSVRIFVDTLWRDPHRSDRPAVESMWQAEERKPA